MASDYLLEIDGIKGESSDDKHKGAIDIESFSWGLSQTSAGPGRGGGGGAGKAVFQDMHFTTQLSSASPLLFLKCATGEHIKKAVLTVRKSGSEQQEYYKITFEDLLVSSYQQSAPSGGDADGTASQVVDSFDLDFAKLEIEYIPQSRDGSSSTPIKAGWDLATNKKA